MFSTSKTIPLVSVVKKTYSISLKNNSAVPWTSVKNNILMQLASSLLIGIYTKAEGVCTI